MPTKHIGGEPEDVADIVLLPGDPLRAKFIAENFLEDSKQFTQVRNILGFTGWYTPRGKTASGETPERVRVSVMGTGMGIPSASIYYTELIRFFGVKKLVRIGTCGVPLSTKAMDAGLYNNESESDAARKNKSVASAGAAVAGARPIRMGDIVVAMGAATDSNHNRLRFGGYDFCAQADFELLEDTVGVLRGGVTGGSSGNYTTDILKNKLEEKGSKFAVSKVFTSDYFYHPEESKVFSLMDKYGYGAIEMEVSALYGCATEWGAQAIALCAVTDEIHPLPASVKDEESGKMRELKAEERWKKLSFKGLSSQEREQNQELLILSALEMAAKNSSRGVY